MQQQLHTRRAAPRTIALLLACGLLLASSACSTSDESSEGSDATAPADLAGEAKTGEATETEVSDSDDEGTEDDAQETQTEPFPPEHCAFYDSGLMDLEGEDEDGDGVPNGWDACPANPSESLDSDRDGVGNQHDVDVDGDGALNEDDEDDDGDGASDADELAAGTDPLDPSSIPDLPTYTYDQGVMKAEAGWYRGDMHVHTEYSHDSEVPVSQRIEEAIGLGLDFLAVTDHRNVDHLFDPDWASDELLLISGVEWGGPRHANTFGLRTDNTAKDWGDWDECLATWSRSRLQGGVQSLNHYGDDAEDWEAFFEARPEVAEALDAFEVWNVWWKTSAAMNRTSIERWETLLDQGHHLAAIGGSDSHFTAFPLGFPTTVVYASNLSQMAILDGIRRGRTYVANPYPYTFGGPGADTDGGSLFSDIGDTPSLVFEADGDGDGTYEAMLGDSLAPGPITFHLVVTHAQGPVEVYKDRDLLTSFTADEAGGTLEETFTDSPDTPCRYRIEMRTKADPDAELLLFSSPIYVE